MFKEGHYTSAAELFYFLLLLLMGLSWLGDKTSVPSIGMKGPVGLYLFCAIAGIFIAKMFNVKSLNIFTEFKSYAGYIFYIYLVPFLIKDKNDIRRCVWALVICSAIPLFEIAPYLNQTRHVDTERYNIAINWGSALNTYVGYILPMVFLALSLFRISSGWIRRGLLLVFISTSLVSLFYSQTRTGWIALSFAFVVYAFLSEKRIKFIIVSSIFLILTIAIYANTKTVSSIISHRIVDETFDKQDSSLQTRFQRWETAKSTFSEYPLTGTGWGGYLVELPDGTLSEESIDILPRWHSSFFEILSQLGLIGVLSFYWIWLRIGKIFFNAWKSARERQDRTILCGLIAAVVSIFVYSFGEQQFYKIETASVSWFITALLIAYARFLNASIMNSTRSQT